MDPNQIPPQGYQGPPAYPPSQPPVAINQDPGVQYSPPQPIEQARLPTEGNEAPPNTYMKPQPQPYNDYVKPPNAPPSNVPVQPVNQFVNVNQNVPNQQNELLLQKILEQQNNMMKENERIRQENEKKAYEQRIHDLEKQNMENQLKHIKELTLAKDSGREIIINNNNNNNNVNNNINANVILVPSTKLQYGFGIYCLILFLNICMPGIGTLVAAFGWGRTVIPDKTGKLICHGIFQLATCIIIYGWIWAVVDALNSFEDGHWAC